MKTSTKLLLLLFVLIPLSMMAYGYLLRKQFDAGNFVEYLYSSDKNEYTFKALPAFKHVVVSGNMRITGESPLTFTSSKKGTGYSTLSGYEGFVKTRTSNDTLFVSFVKFKGKNPNSLGRNICLLYINNNQLQSIKLNKGNYRIKNVAAADLSVNLTNASLDVIESSYKNLTVLADSAKSVSINKSAINLFQYSLKNSSKLKLENNQIKEFQRLAVDNESEISVQGSAKEMEKFLPALSKNQ